MENNKENLSSKSHQDNGALWAILLTVGMVVAMAILIHFIG